MNLVIWHHDSYPTAPGVYLGCFPDRGHRITWITSATGPSNCLLERVEAGTRFVTVQHVEDSRLPRPLSTLVNRWNKLIGFVLKLRLMSQIAASGPDVIQVRERITEGLLGCFFAHRQGIPFAFQFDYPHFEAQLYEFDKRGERRLLQRLILRWWIRQRERLLTSADLVFSISEAQAEGIEKQLGIEAKKIVPFPVGVSRRTFDRAGSNEGFAVAGFERHLPTVCYMGNLAGIREPELIFRIMMEILREDPRVQFLLIGALNAEVDKMIEDYSRRGRILCTGRLPHEQIPAAMRLADVAIFPLPVADPYGLFHSSSPLKVVEYMSCALPVVSSRVHDAAGLLAASGAGVCVDNEPREFATAVLRYLRNPELARSAGAAGRVYIDKHRVFDVMAGNIEAAYKRVLGVDLGPDRKGDRSEPSECAS